LQPMEQVTEARAQKNSMLQPHVILGIATVLYWSCLYIYVPILSPYLHDRGLSMSWIGFILGAYGITQGLVRLPLGMYSDVMSRRKPFLLTGMAAGLISCALFMIPGTWGGPLAGRLMAGLCAAVWVPFTVLYASYYPADKTHQAMGTLSFWQVFGQLAGMSVSGWLASVGGWNYAFMAGIAIAAAGAIVVLFVHEQEENSRASDHAPRMSIAAADKLSGVIRSSHLWRISIVALFAQGTMFITMFGFTPLQAVELGASEAELTLIVVAFMVPHALVSLWTGRSLAPRFGSRKVMTVGFVLAAVFTAAISYSPNLYWLAATQFFNGIAQALYLPLLFSLAIRNFAVAQRATAMGLFQAVYSIGMFAGPYAAGALNAAGGMRAGFLFGAVLALAGAVLTWSKKFED
jgi:predicted MFS family arabinose efflux permease